MKDLTIEEQEQVLAELRWYGKTIAGGGPMIGFAAVGLHANKHWYEVTLPLLEKLGAVYGPDAGAIFRNFRYAHSESTTIQEQEKQQ